MYNMLKKIFIILLFIVVIPLNSTLAASQLGDFMGNLEKTAGNAGAGYDTAQNNPLATISNIIQIVLSLLGVIFLVLTIYSGFLWMTAGGDGSKVETAKKMLTAAIIGLIIIVSAYAISYFVITKLIDKTLT